MTIYQVSARQEEESVMKCPITMATSQLGSRCSHSDLGDPLLSRCHGNTDAMGSFLQADWSRQELKTCKQGFGRKVNERKTRVQGYFWLCAQDFKMLSHKRKKVLKFWSYFSHRKLSDLHNEPFVVPTAVMLWTSTLLTCSSCNTDSVSCSAVHGYQPSHGDRCGGGMCCGCSKGISCSNCFSYVYNNRT